MHALREFTLPLMQVWTQPWCQAGSSHPAISYRAELPKCPAIGSRGRPTVASSPLKYYPEHRAGQPTKYGNLSQLTPLTLRLFH